VAVAVFFSYFIQAYVPIKIMEPWVSENIPEKRHFIFDTTIRVTLVVLACKCLSGVEKGIARVCIAPASHSHRTGIAHA
jgi:hypothetical protein